MNWTSACCFFCLVLLYFLLSLSALSGQVLTPGAFSITNTSAMVEGLVVCIFTKPDVWQQRSMRCCRQSALFKSRQSSTSEVLFFLFLELFAFLALHHSTLSHQGISALFYVNQQQWYQQHLCAASPLALWQPQAEVSQSPFFFLMFPSQSNTWGKVLFRCWSFLPKIISFHVPKGNCCCLFPECCRPSVASCLEKALKMIKFLRQI